MKKVWILSAGTLVSLGLLAGCKTQPSQAYYTPPTEVTTVQQPVGMPEAAVVVKRPIPGQVCWKKRHVWYCRAAHPVTTPATVPAR